MPSVTHAVRVGHALPGAALAILLFGSVPLPVAAAGDIPIRLDERQVRAAGITTVPIDRQRADVELLLPATVMVPPQQVQVVAAPAGGMVEAMLVAADEWVAQGQPIARLRSPDLVEAQRHFLAALAEEALAQDRLRRSQFLFDAKATPERELRVAQTQAANAKSQLDERQQILRLMELSDADIETLRTTRRIFAAVTIHAPRAGTVTKRHVSPGERVDAAAPIYTIAELDPLWLAIQVPAARLPVVQPGATVTLAAYGAQGRIIRIGRTVEPQTQSAVAIAEIESKAGTLRPGLAVTASLSLTNGHGAEWSVPAAAVVRHNDRAWVFVRSADGFAARPVQVAAELPNRVSIRGEFKAEDRVAERGIMALLAELAAAEGE